ncbi:hydrogenase expression/formation protein [Roseicyclus persicicus]|uniref:Hydrogenase expression/formation protein n=1 Tax=Roseicyclus persicicus TaxID=2650661 RepID=A0A7X6JZW1_9RHOB|nr:hydrogenase expression/formation protein [Roseibacterium persicicum]NKX45974.1 hydrogenase expression/formation protein [Roseibacterium persicicum]
MPADFHLPPMGFGPGSQPDPSGEELTYMSMPQDMMVYAPHYPEIENSSAVGPALILLRQVAGACARVAAGGATERFETGGLDAANRALIAETLGTGEVSVKIRTIPAIAAQESRFAGVWVLSGLDHDAIEVGPIPSRALSPGLTPRRAARGAEAPRAGAVINAPPIYAELADKSASWAGKDDLHVVNLSLLPHTPEDLVWLDAALGEGAVTILSRGYGNCRITATALPHVWRVQFFNSMDSLILDTFEVTAMPEVALAAPEDLADSSSRLLKVLEAIA